MLGTSGECTYRQYLWVILKKILYVKPMLVIMIFLLRKVFVFNKNMENDKLILVIE